MLAACKQAGVNIEQCVYIGDAAHDVLAGKSVGMKTLAASYGYLPPNTLINSWGADAIVSSTVDIQQWLESCR
jgi:phosphoglycolate phosphatase